jgi:hypothetical protein
MDTYSNGVRVVTNVTYTADVNNAYIGRLSFACPMLVMWQNAVPGMHSTMSHILPPISFSLDDSTITLLYSVRVRNNTIGVLPTDNSMYNWTMYMVNSKSMRVPTNFGIGCLTKQIVNCAARFDLTIEPRCSFGDTGLILVCGPTFTTTLDNPAFNRAQQQQQQSNVDDTPCLRDLHCAQLLEVCGLRWGHTWACVQMRDDHGIRTCDMWYAYGHRRTGMYPVAHAGTVHCTMSDAGASTLVLR